MARPLGGKKAGGRAKGTPNKITAALKDMILEAADLAGQDMGGEGAVQYLRKQATLNPGPFMSLLGRVLPTQLTGDPAAPLQMVNRIERVIIDADQNPTDTNPEEVRTTH